MVAQMALIEVPEKAFSAFQMFIWFEDKA